MANLIIIEPEQLQKLIEDSITIVLQKQNAQNASSSTGGFSKSNYLNVDEAAAYVHLSKHTLYRLTSTRAIPFIKRGKPLLFVKSELDEWLLQGKKKSRNQIRDEIAGGTQKSA